jgi:Fur family peroxide stress response transcriptional regulator
MGKYKRSRQREKILELLRDVDIHPTALWIYNQLQEEFPNMSMGTVYRNLQVLIEQGLINKIDFGSTFDRFDSNTKPHYHFICEQCGAIIDLDVPINTSLNDTVSNTSSFQVNRHQIEFYGFCGSCRGK